MILTVTPNPAVDKTLFLEKLAPGIKHIASSWTAIAGGKGVNVARAARTLGQAATALVCVAGETGAHVVRMIEADGVACVPVWTEGMTRTITTVLESAVHRQTPLFEPGPGLTPAAVTQLEVELTARAGLATVITFNGTVPSAADTGLYERLVPVAQALGAFVMLDSHGVEFRRGIALKPQLIKPNLQELEELVGRPLPSEADQIAAMREVHQAGVQIVVLTRGAEGCLVLSTEGCMRGVAPAIDEVNAVGSGDCFLGAFAVGIARGWSLDACTRSAIAAGAANAANWEIGRFDLGQLNELSGRVQIQAIA